MEIFKSHYTEIHKDYQHKYAHSQPSTLSILASSHTKIWRSSKRKRYVSQTPQSAIYLTHNSVLLLTKQHQPELMRDAACTALRSSLSNRPETHTHYCCKSGNRALNLAAVSEPRHLEPIYVCKYIKPAAASPSIKSAG